ALGDNVRLFLGVLKSLLVGTFLVSHKLQEVRDVVSPALVANTLYPGVLLVVHIPGIVRRVIEQNLHAICTGFLQTPSRPVVEQVSQAAGTRLVITSLFISQQQSRVLRAPLGRRQSPLRIKQDGRGVGAKPFGDQNLE